MNSRKEEERNEKIIRGLLKLPPNRRCINCNSLGPQYVCTNFWTFICTACSGIHREFTHRVKSVSMAKFTTKEVEALQKGGNQRARDIFLSDWDFQRSRLPDSSNPDRIREFIRSVYVDKKYAGGRTSDKPPRGIETHKSFEEEHRRASSYHSYSQSPPYDHQYEDRRYGKQTGILSRKPGSDRGLYEGKIASFICSPGRLDGQMYEDRFANEISGPRISDYSASSAGDTFKFDGRSPNFQSDSGYVSPQVVRDILIEDGRRPIPGSYSEANTRINVETVPHPQRTASSGSFGRNSVSLRSVDSGSSQEIMIESELATAGQPVQPSFSSGPETSASNKPSSGDTYRSSLVQNQANSSASSIDLFAEINQSTTMSSFVEKSLPQSSLHGNSGNEGPFGPSLVHNAATSSVPSLDLFAKMNQPSSVATLEKSQKTSLASFFQEEGWATFDVPNAGTASQTRTTSYSAVAGTTTLNPSLDNQGFDAFPSTSNNGQWLSAQNSLSRESFMPAVDQWDSTSNEVKIFCGPTSSQTWNAFDDSFGKFPQPPFGSLPVKSDTQVPPHAPPTIVDPGMNLTVQEESGKDGLRMSNIDDGATGMSLSLVSVDTGPSFNAIPPMGENSQECKSTNPFDLPYESDLESSNGFLDMSSLQASLPPVQFPSPFLSGLGQPWYTQNSVPSYISSVTSGICLHKDPLHLLGVIHLGKFNCVDIQLLELMEATLSMCTKLKSCNFPCLHPSCKF